MNDDSSWRRLARSLRAELEPLPAGTRIPTHRELVTRFGASATTVSRALASLRREGVVESRPGSGTFRSRPGAVPLPSDTSWQAAALGVTPALGADPTPLRVHDAAALSTTITSPGADVVDLRGGYLHPELQPLDVLSRAIGRAARSSEAWDRPEAAGHPDLRGWFAAQIGGGLARHDVLITSGGQSALSLAMRAIAAPGDPVVVETPTYPGILAAARAAGLRPVPVPMDGQGLLADHLERALVQTGARLVVVQPCYQNPTGATLGEDRQRDLLALAAAHGAFVVEDDFARYLAHADGPPLPGPLITKDDAGAVVHIRSLTKSTSANLRVAGLAARGPVMAQLRAAHVVDTMFVPALLQHTALDVLAGPAWARAQRALSEALTHRRTVAADSLRHHLPDTLTHEPRGGYHLWVASPSGMDDEEIVARALRAGVAVAPGHSYSTTAAATGRLRLSYVAAPSASDVSAGVSLLASALSPG